VFQGLESYAMAIAVYTATPMRAAALASSHKLRQGSQTFWEYHEFASAYWVRA
jgi:hypothetical protein